MQRLSGKRGVRRRPAPVLAFAAEPIQKAPRQTAHPKQADKECLHAGALMVFAWVILASTNAASPTAKVEPRASDELLTNPGMGWQTFHRFADNDPNLEGLPSASAYFRFYSRLAPGHTSHGLIPPTPD